MDYKRNIALNSHAEIDSIYKTSLRHPNFSTRKKQNKNKLTTLIRLSRKLYYSNKLANNNNLNKVWQTINELIKNSKKSYPDTMIMNGDESNDPIEYLICSMSTSPTLVQS